MKNGIIVEWKKIRHKNLLRISLLAIFVFIILIVLKDIFINTRVKELGIELWIMSIDTILIFLIIPIISGIFYTSMVNGSNSVFSSPHILICLGCRASFAGPDVNIIYLM